MDQYQKAVSIFDKYADQYQEKYLAFDDYVETYKAFYRLLTPSHKTVLDVACGPGNIGRYLLSRNPSLAIHGIDLSARMIELAKENCPSASFEIKDSRKINEINKKFDVLIAGFCFPYLSKDDVANFLKQARQRLTPNGLLYISTMEGEDELSGYGPNPAEDKIYTHYHQFSFLKQHIEDNNFCVIDTIRKQFQADNQQVTTDLFIFARAV